MTTLTIYVVSANLTMLNAIFNGVAMICQQTAFIWGFAMVASMWIILSSVTKAPIAAVSGNGQNVLATGSLGAIMPFILAMLLTFPGFQGTVQVESTVNGQVTVIDNVPFIISAIPSTGSILSQQAGAIVETAFQSTGADYSLISASGNGFINPLKVILASRSAVSRLNGVSSQINSIVTSCLAVDSGIDYSNLNNLVSNAGNSGATAATSITINGADNTAIGALLYQASLSNAYVPSIVDSTNNILNCNDAANLVATNLGNALQSAEFSRVVQGAVNGMDQPSPAANTQFDNITQQWQATRNADVINTALTVGSNQAQNEVINLLMGELVNNELACLSTAGESRIICEAALVQATEIERNNIQMAAAEVPMLKYAGSFGNYLLALIIGLGPIMVMFMMFAGVNAGKCVKTVAHLIAWPLLVTNVGAELINGMMYISIADFTKGLVNGGVVSHAVNVNIFKELSFQIGSASHMMASLPVIMGMIFALGESAALVNVGSNIAPKVTDVDNVTAPKLVNQEAIISQSGFGGANQAPEGAVKHLNGAIPMINASSQQGQDISRASSVIQSALSTDKTKSQLEQVSKDNSKTVTSQNFKEWGFNDSDAKAFRDQLHVGHDASRTYQAGDHNSSTNDNAVHSQAGVGVNAGFSAGGSTPGASIGASANATTQAQATAGLHTNSNSGKDDAVKDAKGTQQVLEKALTFAKTHGLGGRVVKDISQRLSSQQQYTESLTSHQSSSDTQSAALEQTNSITAYSAAISDSNLLAGISRNDETKMFMNVEGHKLLSGNSDVQKNLALAKLDADSSTTTDIAGNSNAREGALLFRAAQITSQDTSASPKSRLEARQFLAGTLNTFQHSGLAKQKDIAAPTMMDDKPDNNTGVNMPKAAAPVATRPATPHHSPKTHAKNSHPQKTKLGTTQQLGEAENNLHKEYDQKTPGFDPVNKYINDTQHAADSGLGDKASGTVVRVAKVIASAAEDTMNPKGTPTAYNRGRGTKTIATGKIRKSDDK